MNADIIEELCKLHTNLTDLEIGAVIQTAAGLPGLAAGSSGHMDYFIDVPCINPSEVVVVAWASSSTSLYEISTVGYIIQEDSEPAVFRSLRLGTETEELKAVTMASTREHFVIQSTKPIVLNGKVIGVLIIEKEHHKPAESLSPEKYTRPQSEESIMNFPGLDNLRQVADLMYEGIILVGSEGRVVYRNPAAAEIYSQYGYDYDILGKEYRKLACHEVITVECAGLVDDMKLPFGEKPDDEGSAQPAEISIRGRYYSIEQHSVKINDETYIMAAFRNITAQRKVERAAIIRQASVQEAHHRIKNSLNIIYGLLDMQRRRSCQPETAEALQLAMNRISSVADTYAIMSGSIEESINLFAILQKIRDHFISMASTGSLELNITVQGNDIKTGGKQATSIALVVTELLYNAYKHAFPGRKRGNIHIACSGTPEYPVISVSDDGTGIPENGGASNGMGFSIINMLVTDELRGNFKIESGKAGTTASFGFINEGDRK